MTKRVVTGRDGVRRPAVDPAPSWSPGTPAVARSYRDDALRLEGEAGRLMRGEARVAGQVAAYTAPHLEPGGTLPHGPARGALARVEIDETGIDPASGRDRQVRRVVRKRRGSRALADLSAQQRSAAERYAALVEAVGAPGAPTLDGPRTGGISDGGASSRCALAQRLDAAHRAIGEAAVLHPRGAQAHADRGRVIVTVLDLVDRVCVDAWPLEQLLQRRGWSRRHEHRRALAEALAAALERLQDVV